MTSSMPSGRCGSAPTSATKATPRRYPKRSGSGLPRSTSFNSSWRRRKLRRPYARPKSRGISTSSKPHSRPTPSMRGRFHRHTSRANTWPDGGPHGLPSSARTSTRCSYLNSAIAWSHCSRSTPAMMTKRRERNDHMCAPSRVRVASLPVLLLLAGSPLTGCYGTTGYVETDDGAYDVDGPAVDPSAAFVATTPPYYYDGRPAYWYDNRWRYREGEAWSHYRTEPPQLRAARMQMGGARPGFVGGQRGGGSRVGVP